MRVVVARRPHAADVLENVEKAQRARALSKAVHVNDTEAISTRRRDWSRCVVHDNSWLQRHRQRHLHQQHDVG